VALGVAWSLALTGFGLGAVPVAQAASLDQPVSDCAGLVAALSDPIAGGPDELVLRLQPSFADSMRSGLCQAEYTSHASHSIPVRLDGSAAGRLTPQAGQRLLDLTNSSGQTVTLTGLNVSQEAGPAPALSSSDGVVRLRQGDWIVRDSIFERQTNTALAVSGSGAFEMEEVVVRHNSGGRGVIVYDGVSSKIRNSSFLSNEYGALRLYGGSASARVSHLVTASNFDQNQATGWGARGAAIYSAPNYADIVIGQSVFTGNAVRAVDEGKNNTIDGGAIALICNGWCDATAPATVVIADSYFERNFAQDDGGAVLVEGAITQTTIKSSLINNTFVGNTVAGAQYGAKLLGRSIVVTDGSGGAVSYYGMTQSEITHNMFYQNGITGVALGTVTNLGAVGGGGAVAVDTDETLVKSPADLPAVPVVTNNVFLGNQIANPLSQSMINLLKSYLGARKSRIKTGNVFIMDGTDADLLDPSQPLQNNGNIGWDNRDTAGVGYGNDGLAPGAGVTPSHVYADLDQSGQPVLRSGPTKVGYGDPVGASGASAQRQFYVISPVSDELYRDGSGPYHVASVRQDVRGYERDHYPNAGPVEIHWTKFDPGVAAGGAWSAGLPADAIQSLADPIVYYRVTQPQETLVAFPRSAVAHPDPDYGFVGWMSDQPTTPGGSDFPIHQPQELVLSSKQTLTAVWEKQRFRVDFDLNHQVDGVHQWGTPYLHVPTGSTIARPADPARGPGHNFAGWFKDAGLTLPWDFDADQVSGDLVLYAKWAPDQQLTVRFVQDGRDVFPAQLVVHGDQAVDPGAPPPPSGAATFGGWLSNGVRYDFAAPVTTDLVLQASWTAGPGGGSSPGPGPGQPSQRPLPITGSELGLSLAWAAVGLILIGWGMIILRRRTV
jgi:uncharacterized repeat protein (TIGR02543 family)